MEASDLLLDMVRKISNPKILQSLVFPLEITHGFDDQGSRYNKDGNLQDWWAGETRQQFEVRAQCIIDQYSAFVEPQTGLNVRGFNTQGENIADNGGIKESYYAYEKWIEDHGEEQGLPGIDLTPKQLFWVSGKKSLKSLEKN